MMLGVVSRERLSGARSGGFEGPPFRPSPVRSPAAPPKGLTSPDLDNHPPSLDNAKQSSRPAPHLPIARGGELDHLLPDRLHGPALLDPPHAGHDAVRAVFVAAVDDVDPRARGAGAARLGDVLHDEGRVRGHDLRGRRKGKGGFRKGGF